MALGAPLLSIIRSADEWLAYSNEIVTLLLSPTVNVFNRDTECYSVLDSTHWPPTLTFARILDSFVMAMNP